MLSPVPAGGSRSQVDLQAALQTAKKRKAEAEGLESQVDTPCIRPCSPCWPRHV